MALQPKEEENLNYLLALMNSDMINKLIHIINPTANNSSNYVKQLPYCEPSEEERTFINKTVDEIMQLDPIADKEKVTALHNSINECIEKIYA